MKYHEASLIGLVNCWAFDNYTVREYRNRLAIARDDGERLTWEEIQQVKSYIWGRRSFAVEIYPPDAEVINKRHTRHIWRLPGVAEDEVRAACTHEEFTRGGGDRATLQDR